MITEKEMTIKEIVDIIRANDEWKQWLERHDRFSQKFIDEAKNGNEAWDRNLLYDFFSKGQGHYIASLTSLGNFSVKEQKDLIENWGNISGLLKQLAENQTTPNWKCYANIKNEIEKYARGNRPATNRLIASLQPQLLCTIVSVGGDNGIESAFKRLKNDIDIPKYIKGDWFRNSYNLLNVFKDQLPNEGYENGIAKYPWEVLEYLSINNIRVKAVNKK